MGVMISNKVARFFMAHGVHTVTKDDSDSCKHESESDLV